MDQTLRRTSAAGSALFRRARPALADLASTITERAAGLFLWVEFILDHLLHDIDGGQPMSKLATRLKQVPRTLEELYAERCQSLSAEERVFSIPLIQWVLFGYEWLKRVHGILLDAACFSPPQGRPLVLLPDRASSLDRAVRLIKDASRGLIEVTTDHKVHEVQFIHETAREFFLTDPRLGLLDPRLAENPKGLSFEALVNGCLNVLDGNVQGLLSVHCQGRVLDYAREVKSHGGSNLVLLDSIRSGKHSELTPKHGESILRFAARHNLTSIVLALLAQGVHPDDAGNDPIFSTPLVAAFSEVFDPSIPDKALIAALLAHGANIETPVFGSTTPLLAAVKKLCEFRSRHLSNGWFDLAEFLAASGAEVNFTDEEGCGILDILVRRFIIHQERLEATNRPERAQHLRLLDTLLARGADPNGKLSADYSNPLHIAARYGDIETAQKLLSHGAAVDPQDPHITPLFWAAACRRPAAVQLCSLLLDHGADPNCRSFDGITPLLYATWFSESAGTIRVLARAGADVNVVADTGNNALHLVAYRARNGDDEPFFLEMVRVLVEAGCSRMGRKREGQIPLEIVSAMKSDMGMKLRKLLVVDD